MSSRLVERIDRRIWPAAVATAFVVLGLLYVFQWSNVVGHHRFEWRPAADLVWTYQGAVALAHGHLGDVYKTSVSQFVSFPGVLFVLLPFGALSGSFHITVLEVEQHHRLLAHPAVLSLTQSNLFFPGPFASQGNLYVAQPWWLAAVVPYVLILSTTVLFACDALAERLGVSKSRRIVLAIVESVLLWNVAVIWGHPEDALALAFAVYALVLALDRRVTGAAWLFGIGVAFQPLVLLMLPLLLVLAGRLRAVGVIIRSAVPASLVLLPILLASFKTTTHALIDQPNYPTRDHVTPWTSLAPTVSHPGQLFAVAGGPGRVVAIVLALGLGLVAAKRFPARLELLVWACAVALAFRCFTESVMDAYYAWPALALGLVVACRGRARVFEVAAVLAVATTVAAQWRLGWITWWTLDIAGLAGVLLVAARPAPLLLAGESKGKQAKAAARRSTSPHTSENDAETTEEPSIRSRSNRAKSARRRRPRPVRS